MNSTTIDVDVTVGMAITSSVGVSLECFSKSEQRQVQFYIAMGLIIIACNSLIILAIISQQELRNSKEYVILAGLALADWLSGWASLSAGMSRWRIFSSCAHRTSVVSRGWCATNALLILFAFGLFVQGVMQVVVTADRLLVVIVPERYFKLTSGGYAFRFVSVGFLASVLFVGYGLAQASGDPTPIAPHCLLLESLHPKYFFVYFLTRIACSLISVAMYGFVVGIFQLRVNPWRKSPEMWQLRTRQRRLIVTIGCCCLCTLLLDTTPNSLAMLAKPMELDLNEVGQFLWPIYCLNAIANIFIYSIGQKEMRIGLMCIFFCWIPLFVGSDDGGSNVGEDGDYEDEEGWAKKADGVAKKGDDGAPVTNKEEIGTKMAFNRTLDVKGKDEHGVAEDLAMVTL